MKKSFFIISVFFIVILFPLYSKAVDTKYISDENEFKNLFQGNGVIIENIIAKGNSNKQFGKFSGASGVKRIF